VIPTKHPRDRNTLRLLLVIRSLNTGGTERQVAALATGLAGAHDVLVATFYPGGSFWNEIEARGVPLVCLEKRGRWDVVGFSWRLWRLLRTWRPTVIQSFLPEPNIFALLAGRLAGVPNIVWGIRSSDVAFEHYDRPLRWTFRAAASLSRWPNLIIANSEAGRRHHVASGFKGPMIVIPNGIDVSTFRPDRASGLAIRRAWGIADHEVLVGLVGRLDPMKGHPLFLRAAARLAADVPHAKFACIGDGDARYAAELRRQGIALGLAERLIWMSTEDAMSPVYSALDVLCSPSVFAEGFSNAIGEAMACAVPCVATDCGDAGSMLADVGRVVARGDEEALAAALREIVAMRATARAAMGERARARAVRFFAVERMIRATQSAYEALLAGHDAGVLERADRRHLAGEIPGDG
jgi:glycosyltransferase involved in cell wall biosynthesis